MNPDSAEKKPVILLCWGYHRKGWVEPFEKLSHQFTFVYLFNITKTPDEVNYSSSEVIYWGDFTSPYDILNFVKPEKVVFMGVISGYAIGLNIACKNSGISTYYLQHGLYQKYSVYREIEITSHKHHGLVPVTANRQSAENEQALRKKSGVLSFLLKALKPKDISYLPALALYFYFMRSKGKFFAAKHIPFALRLPDFYVCYTEKNAAIHFELDRPDPKQLQFIGPPEYDQFFDGKVHPMLLEKPYYLLIDQPLAGSQYFNVGITHQQVNEFYGKLLAFCKSKNAKLAIKLHPENFTDTWLLQDPDIVYFRDEDVVGLIRNCEGCFGTFSTIFIPAIYFKPAVVFRLFNSTVQAHLIELGVVTDLDFFTFEATDIDFGKVLKSGAESPEFIEDYLYKTDGKATSRLGQVLKGGPIQRVRVEQPENAEVVSA